jgi:hypothetical protein
MSRNEIVTELHKPARKTFIRRSVKMVGVDDNWQSDLMILDSYVKFNSGYKYLLIVIDTFSKFLWTRKLKTKSANEVARAMEDILIKSNRKCRLLHTDFGGEYINSTFRRLTEKFNIHHFSTFTHLKASMAERVIRTLRQKLGWYFTKRSNYKWVDIIDQIVDTYNHTKHSTTKLKPIEINKGNEKHILETVYDNNKKKIEKILKKPKFKLGDYVRISKYKKIFEKSTTRNWSTEIFKIVKINKKYPYTYLLEDYQTQPILGQFYEQELLLTKHPHTYLVDKIIKKEKGKSYVSWLGFDSTHNSWVKNKDLV